MLASEVPRRMRARRSSYLPTPPAYNNSATLPSARASKRGGVARINRLDPAVACGFMFGSRSFSAGAHEVSEPRDDPDPGFGMAARSSQ